jgi:2-hydroxychromene-2-carboxylate isomerase
MAGVIDYFFGPTSARAFSVQPVLRGLAARTSTPVRYRPVDLARLPAVRLIRDGKPAGVHSGSHAGHASFAGITSDRAQPPQPFDCALACRLIAAAELLGEDSGLVSYALVSAACARSRNIADPLIATAALVAAGFDGRRLLLRSDSVAAFELAAVHLRAAIDADLHDFPACVLQDRCFCGQDWYAGLARALRPDED